MYPISDSTLLTNRSHRTQFTMRCTGVFSLFALLYPIFCAFAAIEEHQIINLPNLIDPIQFKQFAGHIQLEENEK